MSCWQETNSTPDYRIPQILYQFGCLHYSPPLNSHIRALRPIHSNSNWEIEIRGVSIWCVELIKREIERRHPEVKSQKWQQQKQQQTQQQQDQQRRQELSPPSQQQLSGESLTTPEALEDAKKCTTQKHSKQKSVHEPHFSGVNAILIDFFLYDTMKSLEAEGMETIPHHRTRSIWY